MYALKVNMRRLNLVPGRAQSAVRRSKGSLQLLATLRAVS